MTRLVLGPLRALAPSNMRGNSRDSPTAGACSGNICQAAQNNCCTDIERKKCENLIDETVELKSCDDISYRADQIQPLTDCELPQSVNQSWRSVLTHADGTNKAPLQNGASPPPSSNVDLPPPHAANDPDIIRPIRDPIQLNPLAPPFCPQQRLGDAPDIRYDADYEMWRYATNDIRRNSTCLFGELSGHSKSSEDEWRQTYRRGFEMLKHTPTPSQRRLAKSQARTAQ